MAVEENRFSLALEAAQNVADFRTADRINAVGRLVEDQQFRIMEHGLRSPSRCSMPLEYLRTRVRPHLRSPTVSISSGRRRRISDIDMLLNRP